MEFDFMMVLVFSIFVVGDLFQYKIEGIVYKSVGELVMCYWFLFCVVGYQFDLVFVDICCKIRLVVVQECQK